MTAGFIYSPELTRNILREDHVLRPMRLRLVYELLQAYGVFERPDAVVIEPRVATDLELMSFHGRDYVESVQAFSRGEDLQRQHRYGFSDWGDNPISEGMYEAAALAAGASLVAAEAVWNGEADAVFNAGGGYHHAGPDFASGFCVFNDAVIAILRLLALGAERVAYVDIDAHHGDGVQNAFYSSNRVLTISIHQSGQTLFPGTGACDETGDEPGVGYAVNVPLAPGTHNAAYAHVIENAVAPLIRAFNPGRAGDTAGDRYAHRRPFDSPSAYVRRPYNRRREIGQPLTRQVACHGGRRIRSLRRRAVLGDGLRCDGRRGSSPTIFRRPTRKSTGLNNCVMTLLPTCLRRMTPGVWREAEESVRRGAGADLSSTRDNLVGLIENGGRRNVTTSIQSQIAFGTDGWRAIIAEEFTFDNVRACAKGVSRYVKAEGTAGQGVIVGYDTRFGSERFAAAIAEVLAADGVPAYLCQTWAPTPTISLQRHCQEGRRRDHRDCEPQSA